MQIFLTIQEGKYICEINCRDMADSERSVEGRAVTEPGPNNMNDNNNINESGNKEGELWVELNGSRATPNNNKNNQIVEELINTVKSLQVELLRVREDNEKLMKGKEEINQILLGKIHREGEEEDNKSNEHKEEHVTPSYKKGGRKPHFSGDYQDTSSDNSVENLRHKRDPN